MDFLKGVIMSANPSKKKNCVECGTKTNDYYPLYSKDKDTKDQVRCARCHERFVRQSIRRE
jgi:DNA-directed RNA polymerase subunit RPC12/RpoP